MATVAASSTSPPSSMEGAGGDAAVSLPTGGGNNDTAATGTEGQPPSSPRSTLRTVSLEDIGVVATPDVSAPLPPPQPPLSPVKVPTIPAEYDLTAADMNRLALCMKLASKTDQVKYSPIKPRNVSQSLVCPPHYFAWGHDWSDALRTLYFWYHGLTKEEQKREKKKWANLNARQKKPYNDNIKTLEDNRPAPLSTESTPPEEGTSPPQQVSISRSSVRVIERTAINLSMQRALQNGPSETARAAAGYVPPPSDAAAAETNNTSSGSQTAASRRRGRQATTTITEVVQPTGIASSNEERTELVRSRVQSRKDAPKRRLGVNAHSVGAQADSQAAKAVKKAHIAGAVAMDTCYFAGLPEDQDAPRQVTVVATLNMFPQYNPDGGRQTGVRASRSTLTITALRRSDFALLNDAVELHVNARENPDDPRYANPPNVHLLTGEPESERSMVDIVRSHFGGLTEGRSRPRRSVQSSDVVLAGIAEGRVDEIID